MTQHSSLKVASVGKKHRNVLKRYERIKKLHEMDKWGERQSVYGLPKVKSVKIKVKKTKKTEEEAAAGKAEQTAPAAPAAESKKP